MQEVQGVGAPPQEEPQNPELWDDAPLLHGEI